MHRSLKRKLKKIENRPIIIDKLTSPESAELLYNLHLENSRRKNYDPHNRDKILTLFKTYNQDDQVSIYQAKSEGKLLSMAMVFFFGTDAYNYISGRTIDDENISSSPLLHFARIKESRDRQIKFYNFGGIVNKNQTKHSYFRFSQFKRSFGIDEIRTLPALDLVIKPIRYLPIYARQKQYKITKKL